MSQRLDDTPPCDSKKKDEPEDATATDDDDDDDDEWDVDVEFSSHSAAAARQEPRPDLVWNDKAIVECFQLAIDSHMGISNDTATRMKNILGNEPERSEATTIPLPLWAVDPFLFVGTKQAGTETTKSDEKNSS